MPQQTLNSENNTAVVWMTQTTETVSFPESGAILSPRSPNSEKLANDPVAYWLEMIRHMSNRTIVAYHNALRMPGEKEGVSMKSPHQLYQGFGIVPLSRTVSALHRGWTNSPRWDIMAA